MLVKNLLIVLLSIPFLAQGQSYTEKLQLYREAYRARLLTDKPPLKASDTQYLRFFKPDEDYCVKGTFEPINGARPFMMNTMHGGKPLSVREFGIARFNLKGAALSLVIYRVLATPDDDRTIKLLIPFNDLTNYHETFGGGRYLDVAITDIKGANIVLDFNKSYNPHTAYEKGYPYVIPPRVNTLKVEINAGEKIFGHKPGY